MQLSDILSIELTRCKVKLSSKKRVLEEIAACVAESDSDFNATAVYESLLERERLGSTGIGDGVAIPHCRVNDCKRITGVLLTLESPIEFEAIDDEPVDLVCALLVPTDEKTEHLATLAALADQFGRKEFRSAMRSATDVEKLFTQATSTPDNPRVTA